MLWMKRSAFATDDIGTSDGDFVRFGSLAFTQDDIVKFPIWLIEVISVKTKNLKHTGPDG